MSLVCLIVLSAFGMAVQDPVKIAVVVSGKWSYYGDQLYNQPQQIEHIMHSVGIPYDLIDDTDLEQYTLMDEDNNPNYQAIVVFGGNPLSYAETADNTTLVEAAIGNGTNAIIISSAAGDYQDLLGITSISSTQYGSHVWQIFESYGGDGITYEAHDAGTNATLTGVRVTKVNAYNMTGKTLYANSTVASITFPGMFSFQHGNGTVFYIGAVPYTLSENSRDNLNSSAVYDAFFYAVFNVTEHHVRILPWRRMTSSFITRSDDIVYPYMDGDAASGSINGLIDLRDAGIPIDIGIQPSGYTAQSDDGESTNEGYNLARPTIELVGNFPAGYTWSKSGTHYARNFTAYNYTGIIFDNSTPSDGIMDTILFDTDKDLSFDDETDVCPSKYLPDTQCDFNLSVYDTWSSAYYNMPLRWISQAPLMNASNTTITHVVFSSRSTIDVQWNSTLIPFIQDLLENYSFKIGFHGMHWGMTGASSPNKGEWFRYSNTDNTSNWTVFNQSESVSVIQIWKQDAIAAFGAEYVDMNYWAPWYESGANAQAAFADEQWSSADEGSISRAAFSGWYIFNSTYPPYNKNSMEIANTVNCMTTTQMSRLGLAFASHVAGLVTVASMGAATDKTEFDETSTWFTTHTTQQQHYRNSQYVIEKRTKPEGTHYSGLDEVRPGTNVTYNSTTGNLTLEFVAPENLTQLVWVLPKQMGEKYLMTFTSNDNLTNHKLDSVYGWYVEIPSGTGNYTYITAIYSNESYYIDNITSGVEITNMSSTSTSLMWNESSSNSSLVTNHTIGGLTAGDVIVIKKNGVFWNTTTANASGFANFTYGDGYSTINFEIESQYSNGVACTLAVQCSGGYCVNNYCRSDSIYCGDSVCDTGESCSSCVGDCGVCETTPSSSGVLSQCVDRKDNDGDGLIDMNDPGCRAKWDDNESDDPIKNKTVVVDNEILKNITKGEKVEINITRDGIENVTENKTRVVKKLEIIFSGDKNDVSVEVIQTDAAPEEVSASVSGYKISVEENGVVEDYVAYQYIEVESDVEIEEATLQFEVSKEWMEMQGASKDDVVLLHFVNGEWVELETTYLSGEDLLLFEATIESFSVFAVGVKVDEVVGIGAVPYFMIVFVLIVGIVLMAWQVAKPRTKR